MLGLCGTLLVHTGRSNARIGADDVCTINAPGLSDFQGPTRVPTTAPTPGSLAALSVASASSYRASAAWLPVVNADDRLRLAMTGSNATVLTWRSHNFSAQALAQASLRWCTLANHGQSCVGPAPYVQYLPCVQPSG